MSLNTELTPKEAKLFKMFCDGLGVKYASCQAYNLIHITLFNLDPKQRETLDLFIERLEDLEKAV